LSIIKKIHTPHIISVLVDFVIILTNCYYSVGEMKKDAYPKQEKNYDLFFIQLWNLKRVWAYTSYAHAKNY